jgi:hypothetical protein
MIRRLVLLALPLILAGSALGPAWAQEEAPATQGAAPVEKIPSEDPLIKNMHCMGLIDGRTNIFRCACPVMDVAMHMKIDQPTTRDMQKAVAQMQHLYNLGIRTVVSFDIEKPGPQDRRKPNHEAISVGLEQAAAKAVGVTYLGFPISNNGPDSFETMSDAQVMHWLDTVTDAIVKSAKGGGVAFHCMAGHDRTGLVAAYLRMKYQHWPVEEAIAEMRRYGHNWPIFTKNGVTSWLEDHLRAIAKLLNESPSS